MFLAKYERSFSLHACLRAIGGVEVEGLFESFSVYCGLIDFQPGTVSLC